MVDHICNRIFLTAIVKSLVALAFACGSSGCIAEAINPASAAPSAILSPADVDATIRKFDAETFQPALPDDFKKPNGNAAPAEVASKIEVTVYGPPNCAPCERAIKEGNASPRFHFSKKEQIPAGIAEFANRWNQGAYPIVSFMDRNGAERCVAPWRGLTDFEKRYERTVPTKKAPVNASAGELVYGSLSSAWTWPGDLRSHLVGEHGYTPHQVARMTDREVVAAHDKAHGSRAAVWILGTPRTQPQRPTRRAKRCPTC